MVRPKSDVIRIAQQFGQQLDQLFDGVEIRLFGSYHHGNPHQWSDIDLAVISSDFHHMGYFLALKLLGRLRKSICLEIEAISCTHEDLLDPPLGSIAYEIAHHSELVYQSAF